MEFAFAVHEPESRFVSNVLADSLELKVKLALVESDGSDGEDRMVVSGGVVSTLTVQV